MGEFTLSNLTNTAANYASGTAYGSRALFYNGIATIIEPATGFSDMATQVYYESKWEVGVSYALANDRFQEANRQLSYLLLFGDCPDFANDETLALVERLSPDQDSSLANSLDKAEHAFGQAHFCQTDANTTIYLHLDQVPENLTEAVENANACDSTERTSGIDLFRLDNPDHDAATVLYALHLATAQYVADFDPKSVCSRDGGYFLYADANPHLTEIPL